MNISDVRQFFDFPWAGVAGFVACFTILLLRVPIAARWVGSNVQEMVGVTALRKDLLTMHDENKTNLTRIEDKIDTHKLDEVVHRRE